MLDASGRRPDASKPRRTVVGVNTHAAQRLPCAAALVGAGALLALGMTALGAAPAIAHSPLERSVPADAEQLAAPPSEVLLVFRQPIEELGAALEVDGPDGRLDLDGLLVDERRLSQPLPEDLAAGEYAVLWRVTSADGHPVDGRLSFSVAGGSSAASEPAGNPATGLADSPVTLDPLSEHEPARWLLLGGAAVASLGVVATAVARSRRDKL